MEKTRTRFAPSPTGYLHIGGLRTALYAYALAKSRSGEFILRIEDTDKKREVSGSKQKIKDLLKTFGLNWDEYYVQSERLPLYKNAAEKLVAEGHAFYCECKAKNIKEGVFSKELQDPCRDKKLGSGAIKLMVPDNERVTFNDFILGREVGWDTNTVADTTLLKSDGFPTYHLAVVVDDHEMGISHVLRGHDWLPSTPIHLLVYKYLNYEIPKIGHLTDILDPEGGKLSKRKGSVSCETLLADGYLPGAILNFIMLLGWAPKDNREIYNLSDFVKNFDIKGLQKSNPIFNQVKLDWFNGEYIRKAQNSELKSQIYEFYKKKYSKEVIGRIVPIIKERISKLSEFENIAGFFFKEPEVDNNLFGPNHLSHLRLAEDVLQKIKKFDTTTLNQSLLGEVSGKGLKMGDFFMDLRIAITGKKVTPPINESIVILGKEKTLARLRKALGLKF